VQEEKIARIFAADLSKICLNFVVQAADADACLCGGMAHNQ
jgi:hypothetical protein